MDETLRNMCGGRVGQRGRKSNYQSQGTGYTGYELRGKIEGGVRM